jgi:hypothetical protein
LLNVPPTHGLQVDALELLYDPGQQLSQEPAPAPLKVPGSQLVQFEEFVTLNEPARQDEQCDAAVSLK